MLSCKEIFISILSFNVRDFLESYFSIMVGYIHHYVIYDYYDVKK